MNARRDAALDLPEAAFALLLLTIALWSLIGLTLAEFGWLTRPALLMFGGGGTALALWLARPPLGRNRPPGPSSTRWALLWIVLAAGLFARPGEYLTDGSDGSVYLNIGAALSHRGTLRVHEPLLDDLDAIGGPGSTARAAVLGSGHGWLAVNDFFPGGIQASVTENRVRPNFFHLLPVWIAIFEFVAGPGAGYYVPVVFGVLSILALWMLARQLMPLAGANLAALLCTVNFGQIWFARFPTSEILTQFLILAGVGCAVACTRRPAVLTGVLGGAAFGLAACTRIDVLVLVTPLVAAFLILMAAEHQWHRAWSGMALAMALVTAQAVAHALLIATPYTLRIFFLMSRSPLIGSWGLLLPMTTLAIGAFGWWWYGRSQSAIVRRFLLSVAAIAALLLCVLRIGPAVFSGYLSWLLTPPGFVLALLGLALMLRGDRSPAVALMAGIFLASALVYGESVRDQALMPLLFRRFIPVVVPFALLFAAYAISRTAQAARRWRHAVLIVPAVLTVLLVIRSRPILATAAMRGVHGQLAQLADRIPLDALVVTDATTPSHLGLSLHDTFDRDVLFVDPAPDTARVLGALVRRRTAAGHPVLLVTGGSSGEPDALSADDLVELTLMPAGEWTLHERQLESTTNRFPSVFVDVAPVLTLYRAVPRTSPSLPLRLDLGDHDAGIRVEGFYPDERMGAARARWTSGAAVLELPQVRVTTGLVLRMRIAAPRPSGMTPPAATLELDGHIIGTTPPLSAAFQEVELPVPPASAARLAGGPSHLIVRAPTFVPSEQGGGGDRRRLGVAIDWVVLEVR